MMVSDRIHAMPAPIAVAAGVVLALFSAAQLFADVANRTSIQPIVLLAPSEAASYRVGDTVAIRWKANQELIGRVILDISANSGRSWETFSQNGAEPSIRSGDSAFYDGSEGTYQWIIPERLFSMSLWDSVSLVSDSCLLRVWDPYSMEEHGELYESRTEHFFAIKAASAAAAIRPIRAATPKQRIRAYYLANGRIARFSGRTRTRCSSGIAVYCTPSVARLSKPFNSGRQ